MAVVPIVDPGNDVAMSRHDTAGVVCDNAAYTGEIKRIFFI